MSKLISVIINCYNQDKFLEKCLDSVINQTYKNLEIIIVDDGSTDNTLKISKKYQKKDNRIKVISTPNYGLSKSRNIGIDNSTGDYLYFVDSDDIIEKDVIEYLYNISIKYDVCISTCKPLTIYNYDYKYKNKKEKIDILNDVQMLKKVLLIEDKANTFWNKLYKRELFDDIRFEDRIINDMTVVHKLIIKTKRIAYSNQIKYFYFRHTGAVTYRKNIKLERNIDKYLVSKERYEYIKKIYPNLIENDIYLISNTIILYLEDNKELIKYLDNDNAYQMIKKLFNLKILFYPMKISSKIRIILFFINRKLCKKIYNKVRENKI